VPESDSTTSKATAVQPCPAPASRRQRIRRMAQVFGVLAVAAALVMGLLAVYEIWAKPLQTGQQQDRLDQQVQREWDTPSQTGSQQDRTRQDAEQPEIFARLYLPKLNQHWVVVRGVGEADIEHAPGYYPDSQLPGQRGNVAIVGHRRKRLFWHLDKIKPGDVVMLETRTQWITYRVYRTRTVAPADVAVVSANPDNPQASPTRRLLTLVTCAPKLSTAKRLIVHAEMESARPRNQGPPPELQPG